MKNPYYKGCVTHKGEIYPGEHEAIIDEATWEHAQTLFKKHDGSNRKGYNTASPSFLKGILKCEKCGVAMTPTYAYNHGLRYRYYACSNHIRSKSCGSTFKTIPAEDVEQKVIDEVLQILRSPEVTVNVAKIAEEHAGKGTDAEVSKQNLIVALRNLTDVWAYLYTTEQHKVVEMLVEEVAVGDNWIRLRMNLEGFDAVMREMMR